ncbi:aminotransferase class IV [Ornithobacterium rhinotracheale]|uniref:aminotransferase class IV n=1 Tax=Ornithobacterium rhinotracheale TaxID=28251 RepID=UPI001FF260B9|nr:aminotransferase class IV [Ornithobacterium rhinotracheale]MCK0203613.1 aminotransferase class IV [Ornithobacterium rhinotracheale]
MDFLESIKIENHKIYHLAEHQKRVNQTFEKFPPKAEVLDLEQIFSQQVIPKEGLFKARIVYSDQGYSLEISPYTPKKITSLKVVTKNDISYDFKFLNRDALNGLNDKPEQEVIIVKNDQITDSSYANLVFYDGKKWVTPKTYLLNGTCRQRLLKEGKITEEKIEKKDIQKYQKIGFINAMLDLGEMTWDIDIVEL